MSDRTPDSGQGPALLRGLFHRGPLHWFTGCWHDAPDSRKVVTGHTLARQPSTAKVPEDQCCKCGRRRRYTPYSYD